MPTFKPKNTKKIIIQKNITTLDSKHKEFVDSFTNDKQDLLPTLLDEKNAIYEKLKKKKISIDESLELKDKLVEIKKKINDIKNKEKNYLLNNSSYIFNYFENKKKINKYNIKINN